MDTKKEKKNSYSIINGPNKDTLFDNCKYACNKHAKLEVGFNVLIGHNTPLSNPGCAYALMQIIDVKIYGIQYKDRNSESFHLSGSCKADLTSIGRSNATFKPYWFEADYDSRLRKGSIEFTEE